MKKDLMKKIFFIILISLILIQCSNKKSRLKKAFKDFRGKYILYITKHNFNLNVYNTHFDIIESYKIGYGSNPDKMAKLYCGDNRTPEGIYEIIEMLSMDADKNRSSYKKLKEMNNVYFKAKDGHPKYGKPDVDLGKNAYGSRFFRLNYPNSEDLLIYKNAITQGKIALINNNPRSIGSGIAIHGNNDEHSISQLSSSGCIRMYNADIVELEKYVQIGTPVIISAK